jgi:hypothetical protein
MRMKPTAANTGDSQLEGMGRRRWESEADREMTRVEAQGGHHD